MPAHAFRFGVFSHNMSSSVGALLSQARRAEELGYATFLIPDHIGDHFASSLALAQVAAATTTLRVGSCVFDNDFRHPVMLAKDVVTLDIFSSGRFEFGLGAGWMASEYEQCGLSFDPPRVRIERTAEALQIVKRLLAGETLNFDGAHYKLSQCALSAAPLQRPHPPVLVGGSGRRMLSLAAREADIVSFTPRTQASSVEGHMNHALDIGDALPEALRQKVAWVRQAAGERFPALELSIVVLDILVTAERWRGAAQLAERYHLSAEQVLESPFFLVGSVEEICAQIWRNRETYGISYLVVWEEHLELFAPIVAHLKA